MGVVRAVMVGGSAGFTMDVTTEAAVELVGLNSGQVEGVGGERVERCRSAAV